MIRRRTVAAFALTGAAALVLPLAACAPEPAPSASATGGASPTATASGAPTASTTPSATPTADAAACLIGDWTMDQDSMADFYADINDLLAGSGVTFEPEGTATLTLGEDGSFRWAPEAEVTAEASGTEVLIALSGHLDGAYTATESRITTTEQSTDALTVAATIGGAPTDPGSITEEIAAAPITAAGYTCSDDTLTLDSEVAGGTATAVLHR